MTGALQQTQQRQAHLDEQQLVGIRAAVRGQICVKGSPGYDEARTIWNAMIDRYPDVVIRCARVRLAAGPHSNERRGRRSCVFGDPQTRVRVPLVRRMERR
jgi:hypothetical protein